MKAAAKKAERENNKIVAQNRAASYNYDLLDKFEAGLVLVGTEVKTLREGKGTIREAYAEIRNGEAWLINCHIPEYQPGGPRNHDPLRKRKLLLNRREIEKLDAAIQQKGMTVVPLKIYFRDGTGEMRTGDRQGQEIPRPPRIRAQQGSQTRSGRSDIPLSPPIKVKGRHADPTRDPAVRFARSRRPRNLRLR